MDYSKKWAFAIEAYNGDGGFETGEYLDQHGREADDKYAKRKEVTDYSNIFVQKVSRYIGYFYKEKPIRATDDKMIQAIIEDADNAGNSMNVFMSGFAKKAKVRGVGLALIDMPQEIPETLAEQLEERALPYLVELIPENVIDYKLDKFGKFEYIAYKAERDNSEYQDEDIEPIIRYYDKFNWRIYDEDGDFLEGGDHNLGLCPVIFMGENGQYPDIGEFTQVSNIAKRHYNLESEMDDILRGQTFSILTINAENPSDVKITLSTDNAIKYGANMKTPSFIAPDAAPAATYETRIQTLEERINEITYDISTGLSAEAGISLDIKFQGLNGSLSAFAMRMEDFELRAFEIMAKYIKSTEETKVVYPNTFDITDLIKEIATLQSVKNLGYRIPTYEKVKLQQIVSNDLSTLPKEEVDQINIEIEDLLKEPTL